MSGAAARARPSPSDPACAAFDAAGNRVVWVRRAAAPGDAAAARSLLGTSPDPGAEILAVLGLEGRRPRAWFYNPDGSPERLCGNALRCLAAFVGADRAQRVLAWTALGAAASWVDARGVAWAAIPRAPLAVSEHAGFHLVDVGTPHRVACVADVTAPEVSALGRRLSAGADAVNATFFTPEGRTALRVRTLERGVLAETGSCGTGAIAAYLAALAATPRALADRITARFPSGEVLEVRALGWGRWLAVGGRARRTR
ncbi:MAG TPA: hypothetical protein PLU22_00530 [Polyangiaceae bacterium]|nr:hypothetical protein [Polyangiaceae bacterium]